MMERLPAHLARVWQLNDAELKEEVDGGRLDNNRIKNLAQALKLYLDRYHSDYRWMVKHYTTAQAEYKTARFRGAQYAFLNYEKSGTFNLGSNQTWSLNDVIKIIENNLEKKSKISYQERAYKDVDVVLPSLEISKNLLNWEPKVNVEDGIKKTVEWYLEHSSILKNIKFKYDYEQ